MKKFWALVFIFTPALSHAIFSIGITGGQDYYTIAEYNKSFELGGDTLVSLKRDVVENPLLFGVKCGIDIIPFIDLEIGADMAIKKYNFTYIYPVDISVQDTLTQKLTFSRIGIYLNLQRNFFSFPPAVSVFSLYGGAGANLQIMTPILCEALIVDNLKSATDTLDELALVKRATKYGGHIVTGLKLKPPMIPVAVDVNFRYTFILGECKYEEPSSFFSIYAGLSYAM